MQKVREDSYYHKFSGRVWDLECAYGAILLGPTELCSDPKQLISFPSWSPPSASSWTKKSFGSEASPGVSHL